MSLSLSACGLKVEHPNHVWQTDITYIPMFRGHMFMAAIIDVYSRKIVGWSLSNTMTAQWCADLLTDTIKLHGKPHIHNSDQGSQYTSEIYLNILKQNNIQISMDGKGRAIEQHLHRTFLAFIKARKNLSKPSQRGLGIIPTNQPIHPILQHKKKA
ncbi:MAG: DDE-type integrase/transposase/recombinase [Bacteroidia bacterium]